ARLVFVRGVDQHGSGNLVRVETRVDADVQPSERMTDEKIRRGNSGALQQRVQLGGHLRAGPGIRTRVAPPVAGAVEPAGPRAARDLGLDVRPGHPGLAGAGIEDHGGGSLAGAEYIEAVTADVKPPADLREALEVLVGADLFVADAGGCQDEQDYEGKSPFAAAAVRDWRHWLTA